MTPRRMAKYNPNTQYNRHSGLLKQIGYPSASLPNNQLGSVNSF
jgi:hypothetical protein